MVPLVSPVYRLVLLRIPIYSGLSASRSGSIHRQKAAVGISAAVSGCLRDGPGWKVLNFYLPSLEKCRLHAKVFPALFIYDCHCRLSA